MMRILFLNKRTILAAVFIMSGICSVAANATCDFEGQKLKTFDGAAVKQVWDDGVASDQCSSTPNQYEVTFYKIAICKENPSNNDLTSCRYLVNEDSGVKHIITKGIESTMSISGFEIEPGTYPYMVSIVSSKLGIKHSFTTTFSVQGSSGAGTNCWTANPGPSSYTNQSFVSVAHGTTVDHTVQLIDCGVSLGTPVFSYEVIGKLTGDVCADAWGDLGDRDTYPAEGAVVSLLDQNNTWASSCETAAKMFFVKKNMAAPFLVRPTSLYNLSIKTTDSVSIDFDNGANSNIIKTGADPIQIRLTINN